MKTQQIVTILAILTMVAICILPVAAEVDDEATIYYNNAQVLIADGDYARALDYLDMVLVSNTTLLGMGDGLMYTYKDRVALLADLGRYDDAIAAADEGIALYPEEPGFWNNKGYTYMKMGKYTEAAEAYDHAVTIDPTYIKGWINKGDALMMADKPGDAASAYRKALELDPGNEDATAGLTKAQQAPVSPCIVIGAVLVIWYVKARRPGDGAAKKEKN